MGKYINGIGTTYQEKINNLKANHNAEETDASYKEDLVCVVDNGPFAAAGYCYDEEEFKAFIGNFSDFRRKTWLIVPNAEELAD